MTDSQANEGDYFCLSQLRQRSLRPPNFLRDDRVHFVAVGWGSYKDFLGQMQARRDFPINDGCVRLSNSFLNRRWFSFLIGDDAYDGREEISNYYRECTTARRTG